jgi:GAF domain-containing protein
MRMTGAGIMLMAGDVPRGTVCSSDAVSASIEDFQFTLGEGPCVDAYTQGQPVMEEDLAEPDVARWIAFSPRALDVGARAVFGYPLRVGAVCIGAMNLYRDRPGPLDDEQHLDGLVLAGVAARAVLAMQSGAQPGVLGAGLEVGSDFRLVVHQASGMVAAQLDVGVGEALARLRAYAFAQNRLLTEVAGDVVTRSLRFE